MSHSIGVVIPVYNQESYLWRALCSAVWQKEPEDEVIVVDDGSPKPIDLGMIKAFSNQVMWLRNPFNRGVSFSRNQAILRSRAEWIKFLDADDVLAPFALNIIRNAGQELPLEIKVIAGGCHRMVNQRYEDYLCDPVESLQRIKEKNPLLPSAVFARRSALLEVGLFDERIDFEEDWDMWLKLHERYGQDCFAMTTQPVCYYWIDQEERNHKARTACVDGMPVRDYFRKRYGVEPA